MDSFIKFLKELLVLINKIWDSTVTGTSEKVRKAKEKIREKYEKMKKTGRPQW